MKNKAITKLRVFFSNIFYKSWEPAVSVTVTLSVSVSLSVTVSLFVTLFVSVSVDPWDMLNNFCCHV